MQKEFNVIRYNINSNKMEAYNVLPYFINKFNTTWEKKPTKFSELRAFIKSWAMYQFCGRCEYEIILTGWPTCHNTAEEKWDVYDQILLNLDLITKLVGKEVFKTKR